MRTFKVGELVILQNASYFTEWDGALGVIVGGLQLRNPIDLHTLEHVLDLAYEVKVIVPDGHIVIASPWQVRQLGNPSDEKVSSTEGELAEVIIR